MLLDRLRVYMPYLTLLDRRDTCVTPCHMCHRLSVLHLEPPGTVPLLPRRPPGYSRRETT